MDSYKDKSVKFVRIKGRIVPIKKKDPTKQTEPKKYLPDRKQKEIKKKLEKKIKEHKTFKLTSTGIGFTALDKLVKQNEKKIENIEKKAMTFAIAATGLGTSLGAGGILFGKYGQATVAKARKVNVKYTTMAARRKNANLHKLMEKQYRINLRLRQLGGLSKKTGKIGSKIFKMSTFLGKIFIK